MYSNDCSPLHQSFELYFFGLAEGAEGEESDDDERQNLVKLVNYLRALVNGDNLQGDEEAMET